MTVKVLNVTRTPGHHCQLVRVCASTSTDAGKEDMLFSPVELGTEKEWITGHLNSITKLDTFAHPCVDGSFWQRQHTSVP